MYIYMYEDAMSHVYIYMCIYVDGSSFVIFPRFSSEMIKELDQK